MEEHSREATAKQKTKAVPERHRENLKRFSCWKPVQLLFAINYSNLLLYSSQAGMDLLLAIGKSWLRK